MLHEIVRLSPVSRQHLVNAARANGLIGDGALALQKMRTCLTRLSCRGVVLFDQTTVYWTGKAPPPRGLGAAASYRINRSAAGSHAVAAQLRDAELAKVAARRDAQLWALRPADAPPVLPLPTITPHARKQQRPQPSITSRQRELLTDLSRDRDRLQRALDQTAADRSI